MDNIVWLKQIDNARQGKQVKCPKCASSDVEMELCAFENLVGYAYAKCNTCNSDVWVSRILYRKTDKFKTISAQ